MLAYTYLEKGTFRLTDKPKPVLREPGDALVRVTLSSICTSDLHIKHGSVPRAVPGITVGHEMVGVVESVGPGVRTVRPGDRVSVNVETFCGECFFCRHGYVNNCTDPSGGWALGCRIDGGQAEYVRVPYADQGLTKIPESVTDRQALFAGDILATGFWAARIAEIGPEDTVLILGAGPTGICTLLCVLLKAPKQVIVCEKDPARLRFVREHYPQVLTVGPEEVLAFTQAHSDHGGADRVLEVAGAEETFRLAWQCARPNAVVTVVALYDRPQLLPLPEMYGKNLTFKTGGAVFIVAYNLLGSIFRGIGDSRVSLITVLIACILNIGGDLLLVGGFGLNVAGAAIATVFAQAMSVALSLLLIRGKHLAFILRRQDIRFDGAIIGRILKLGSPVALQDLLVNITFLVIIAIANSMGTIPSAGVGVAEKLCAFVMLVPSAYMQSMSAFVAQNIGAGLETRARRALLYGVLSSLMAGLLMGWAAFFHGDVLAGIFADDPAVIAAAWEYLKAYAIDCLLTSFLFCFVGFFNGCGQTLFVMAQGMVGALGVRLPVALLVSRAADSSLFHLGLATPASTVVQIFLCGIWYLRRSHRLNRLGLIRK